MTLLHSIPSSYIFVAIDIAKVRNEVLLALPGKKARNA